MKDINKVNEEDRILQKEKKKEIKKHASKLEKRTEMRKGKRLKKKGEGTQEIDNTDKEARMKESTVA